MPIIKAELRGTGEPKQIHDKRCAPSFGDMYDNDIEHIFVHQRRQEASTKALKATTLDEPRGNYRW